MNVISITQSQHLWSSIQKLLDVIASEPFANIRIAETLGVLEILKYSLLMNTKEQ